ncbi:insulinase family protein [Candidatus Chloroploca sp. M-50]|uniref:Insulinase family protein n=1 Tax=Candidatus Chloroploca mongolica TaxID=2528176 RepID=A0ABS4D812_9CHLR|nr:pitrilysin family protein [Candidatus Chloroploca mongolica]MBP1465576.1 insulinase family protein [Candidatus Chloroploca mongolica]
MKIHAHTLANGMLVLIREVHSAPVATSWIWYRVGSRNEPTGQTGISHWVEHMLFKGTPAVPRGELDRLIARNGGTFNGFTWVDYTAYYETLPADRIELALRLEADRMVNALFEPDEVESERTVIIAELEGAANYPETWLDEAVKASAFTAHPYRHPVIGYKSDLLAMTRDELYTYYQTFYMPKNAVLVIVGDVDTDTILRQAETHFGSLPSGPSLPLVRAVEPEPQGERRVVIRRPGPAQYVQIGFLAPDCHHPDFAATVVLDAVLSGAKAPSFMGGGAPTNRSARIYQALVETELAAAAWSSFMPTRDPYLFELSAIVSEAHSAEEVEAALLHELVKIQQDGITPNELARVLKQMRAQIAYSLESVTNQALQIGMWEVLDSYQRGETLLEELAAVEAADVQRIAQTYLTSKRSVTGFFLPTSEGLEDSLT